MWPRSQQVPSFNVLNPPAVRVSVGEPVDLKYRSVKTDTVRIMDALSALLPDEANTPYTPTIEELQKTFPPGYTMTDDDIGDSVEGVTRGAAS